MKRETGYTLGGIRPVLPEDGTAWIAPGARLIGRVRLLAGASVWFNAVLRGDNEWITIGEGSNVQDLAMLHTDPGFPLEIGARCTIGHSAILHGCTIGNGSLIGMGAIVMNGACIGAGSIVGAGTLVPEGKEYPEGSLIIGTPGKLIRILSAEEREKAARGHIRYLENAKRYLHEMAP